MAQNHELKDVTYEQNDDDAWMDGHTATKVAKEIKAGDRFVLYGWHFYSLDWHVFEATHDAVREGLGGLFVQLKDEDNLIFSRYSSIVRVLHSWVDADEFLAQYVLRLTAQLTPAGRRRLMQLLGTSR